MSCDTSLQVPFTTSLCVLVTAASQTSVSRSKLILRQIDGLVDVGRHASGVACSNDLTAGLEVPRSTRVPQPRPLGDGVQDIADADVALLNALDRGVVIRARDGVVILGRGVTVLRYHVWAMSAPSWHLGSFRLVSLVLLVSYPQPPPFGEQGVLWVPTRVMTHPGKWGVPSERQLVLWIVVCTGVCS